MSAAAIVIVGAGPAGIAAAVRAHACGAVVTIVDDNPGIGGQIWRLESAANPWIKRFHAVRPLVLHGAQVISGDAQRLCVESAMGSEEIRYDKLILATGAREVFLPFPGWTLPGVLGVGGLQALAKSGLPIRGKRIVVAGSGPLLLAVTAYLRKNGAVVILLAEQAKRRMLLRFAVGLLKYPAKLAQALSLQFSLAGVSQHHDCWVEAAEGDRKLERVRIRQGSATWNEECDFAAIAYGLCPNVELGSLLGCELRGQELATDEFQQSSVPNILCAGECTGVGGVDLATVEGEIAGYAAGGDLERARSLFGNRERARRFATAMNAAFALRPELKQVPQPDTLVCRCEDVSWRQLQSHSSFRSAKLHTRCGMGPCQGRVCGPAVRFLFGWNTDSVRPPIFTARIKTLLNREESTKTE